MQCSLETKNSLLWLVNQQQHFHYDIDSGKYVFEAVSRETAYFITLHFDSHPTDAEAVH
jgi:hypothetical protein